MSDSCLLPEYDIAQAAEILRRLFALEGSIRQLAGERDLNFLIDGEAGKYVFKIANADEDPAMLECQHQVFERLAAAAVFETAVTALESVHGRRIEILRDDTGREHACRVLPFVEGRMMEAFPLLQPAFLEDLGRRLALLDIALADFSHPALERPLLWRMDDVLTTLQRFKPKLATLEQRQMVEHFEAGYRVQVIPRQSQLRRGVIHNDANQCNLLLDESGTEFAGIIDFGDMVESWLIVEPAIAACYAMLGREDPVGIARRVLRGYHRALPLREAEIDCAPDFLCMRLCMSVCVCAHQRRLQPDNEYLSTDEAAIWDLLGNLCSMDADKLRASLRDACEIA